MDFTLIIQALVAVGTLALASATFLLGWNSVKERQASEASELAVGAYNPLRAEALGWTNLQTAHFSASNNTWTNLKQSHLDLVSRFPKEITAALDASEKDVSRVGFLRYKVSLPINAALEKLSNELDPKRQAGSTVVVRLIVSKVYISPIDPTLVWLSGKGLKNYLDNFVASHYPDNSWDVQIMVGNAVVGGLKETEQFCNSFSGLLDDDSEAPEYRELISKIAVHGKTINSLIEKELKKH